MNYFYIIVGIILFEYLLSFIVRTLNLKALDPNLPSEFCVCIPESVKIEIQEFSLPAINEKSSFQVKKKEVKEIKK